ncbi:DUF6415 family natural product biosynthesis protein [Streptomyces sp. NPDC014986]|jgi:hypothetical protein|uniref:DUF6415 family natural product biosynthesis protein n=1 Tax=Streptomyces sp. NPDC014986 TaxID=3364934 RepID=UPI00370142B7
MASKSAAPIDVETIRATYDRLLWGADITGSECEILAGLVRGHVGLLVQEGAALVSRLHGHQQFVARWVLVQSRRMLRTSRGDDSPEQLRDLATQCRALLVLHEFAGPLHPPA